MIFVIKKLKYGNTNTFFIRETGGGLLVDTDFAGTLPAFYKAIKRCDIKIGDISYVLATHYHPDHIGLVSELMKQGIKLLLIDTQKPYIHFADEINDWIMNLSTLINQSLSAVKTVGNFLKIWALREKLYLLQAIVRIAYL